ncbi:MULTISPECIES: hypothetical protein [Pseudomonas syringae group]|jgi:hypothetical protein|uniref:DUF2059 domain-containing protein n=4 Tax=Pseudomonas syringae group TaxID=136849 RepID=A0AB38C0X5_PSESX|nr:MULTISPECIES: hypothetical protein [Pseudomonas syringae group]EGH28481.1 hypothetical protein PSYJA_05564 [Pseudomonas syringae pv. japonica str. M301072]KZL37667.1 hypothetical protein VT47_18000 [Pseudomonas syringae pv. syringae]MBI6767860.1 hypothetical protein [Pseudomonas syringae]MBI6787316.1 hypothetical protein [Pseudomonas syringae]MBI6797627.1 hypothetical protein [Pseudomonas syringae]
MTDHARGSRGNWQTCLALLACLCLDAMHPASAEEADDMALALVEQRNLGEGLAWLGYQVASRTATFAGIVQAVGKTEAQELVQKELQRLKPEYQAQWDRNLAAAYAHAFTAEELRSLNQGADSPALGNRFRSRNTQVSVDMKARSSELLGQFVSRALSNAEAALRR